MDKWVWRDIWISEENFGNTSGTYPSTLEGDGRIISIPSCCWMKLWVLSWWENPIPAQSLTYFVSEALVDDQTRYQKIEKVYLL